MTGAPTEDRSGPPAAARPRGWQHAREVGSSVGVRFLFFFARLFGRPASRAFLRPLVLYYVLSRPSLRRASRAFRARVGAEAGLRDVYRHVLRFAEVALDRVFLLEGRTDLFEVTLDGHAHVAEMARSGRGGLLLGAHLGSFEAMRLAAVVKEIPIHVVMDNRNARRAASVLARVDPGGTLRILEVGDGGVEVAVRIREIIDRGELVAILADRARDDERAVRVQMLGGTVRLPSGPYLLAAALGCPVYLAFGLYRGGNRYDLFCEPFAERITLERPREAHVAEWASRYAARLAERAREAPDNWFNFFELWEPEQGSGAGAVRSAREDVDAAA